VACHCLSLETLLPFGSEAQCGRREGIKKAGLQAGLWLRTGHRGTRGKAGPQDTTARRRGTQN